MSHAQVEIHSMKLSDILRFWSKVDKSDGCWIWTAGKSEGYGSFKLCGKSVYAHRVSYSLAYGFIPDGLQLDHLVCGNHSCVNPNHLEPVTIKVNVLRGQGHSAANARKTHCRNGHEFTESNTYVDTGTRNGRRSCRMCKRLWKQNRRDKL